MSDISPEIMDRITKVCICKAIPRSTIRKAIRSGADTLVKVREATGAGSGPCNGRRCTPKILELLEEMRMEHDSHDAP